jgi:2-amino-4-hydroxy-6-hydroxymethyldihydropteridine diphosphokinase
MDIDILFYDQKIIDKPELTIPHKMLHKRKFVLVPLAEIASDLIHPVFNKNIRTLLDECDDKGMVKKIS